VIAPHQVSGHYVMDPNEVLLLLADLRG
jgi:hypothetical protein